MTTITVKYRTIVIYGLRYGKERGQVHYNTNETESSREKKISGIKPDNIRKDIVEKITKSLEKEYNFADKLRIYVVDISIMDSDGKWKYLPV